MITRAGGQPNTWVHRQQQCDRHRQQQFSTPVTFNNLASTAGKITVNISGSYNYINGFTLTELGSAKSATLNQLPVAVAGANQSINLPVNQVTVNGSGSHDPDMGPLQATTGYSYRVPHRQPSPRQTTAITTITGLDSGTYFFQLTVTDNAGAVSTSTLKVTVGTTGLNNIPPIANAGPDLIVNLPVDSVQLDGSASHDPDGTIARYSWAKIGGPTQFALNSTSAVKPTVSNLYAGQYQF